VTWLQAVIRNVLLFIPFVLVLGYYFENAMTLAKSRRFGDIWAKTQVVEV